MAGDTTQIQLIGIAGSAGSGKDLATEIVCRLYGATNISTSEFVRAITRHVYDLPADFNPIRDQLFGVATFLRNEINPATTVKLSIFKAQAQGVEIAVLSGLRSMGEADALREAGGIIVAVDADPKRRYERIYSRQRDTEAQKTLEQFLVQDAYENKGVSAEGPGRGISFITQSADVLITNDGTLEDLETQIKTKLDALLSRA
jgi:dephospho-CoA kinase